MSERRRSSRERESGAKGLVRIKIISMGAPMTGKSCLIKRYCEERFVSKYISTIGVDYGVKPVNVRGLDVRVNFWDLSGQPEFFEVRNEFYRDAQAALLVYDVTNRDSFDELAQWLEEASRFGVGDIPVALCANKVDKRRVVSEEEGRAWAQGHGFEYFETSANSGANVADSFHFLFDRAVRANEG